MGKQRLRLSQCITEQLFVADTLENGAGYVRRIFDVDRLAELLKRHYEDLEHSWTAPNHVSCDRSCHDCLRNYQNRFNHALLDWRLALDLAEIALGRTLSEDRWLKQAPDIGQRFVKLCEMNGIDAWLEQAGRLVAVVRDGPMALVLGHPLWHEREGLACDPQRDAKLELQERHGAQVACRFVDIREFQQRPQKYIVAWQRS